MTGKLFGWVDGVFGNTSLSQKVILVGTGLPLVAAFAANVSPYSEFMRGFIARGPIPISGGFLTAAGLITGTALFAAIQYAEVYVLTLGRTTAGRGFANFLSTFAYVVDICACLTFFPPVSGSLLVFMFAPSLSGIDWLNVLIIVLTVFGGGWWLKLRLAFIANTAGTGRTINVNAEAA